MTRDSIWTEAAWLTISMSTQKMVRRDDITMHINKIKCKHLFINMTSFFVINSISHLMEEQSSESW